MWFRCENTNEAAVKPKIGTGIQTSALLGSKNVEERASLLG